MKRLSCLSFAVCLAFILGLMTGCDDSGNSDPTGSGILTGRWSGYYFYGFGMIYIHTQTWSVSHEGSTVTIDYDYDNEADTKGTMSATYDSSSRIMTTEHGSEFRLSADNNTLLYAPDLNGPNAHGSMVRQ